MMIQDKFKLKQDETLEQIINALISKSNLDQEELKMLREDVDLLTEVLNKSLIKMTELTSTVAQLYTENKYAD